MKKFFKIIRYMVFLIIASLLSTLGIGKSETTYKAGDSKVGDSKTSQLGIATVAYADAPAGDSSPTPDCDGGPGDGPGDGGC